MWGEKLFVCPDMLGIKSLARFRTGSPLGWRLPSEAPELPELPGWYLSEAFCDGEFIPDDSVPDAIICPLVIGFGLGKGDVLLAMAALARAPPICTLR